MIKRLKWNVLYGGGDGAESDGGLTSSSEEDDDVDLSARQAEANKLLQELVERDPDLAQTLHQKLEALTKSSSEDDSDDESVVADTASDDDVTVETRRDKDVGDATHSAQNLSGSGDDSPSEEVHPDTIDAEEDDDDSDQEYARWRECNLCPGKRFLNDREVEAHLASVNHRRAVAKYEKRIQAAPKKQESKFDSAVTPASGNGAHDAKNPSKEADGKSKKEVMNAASVLIDNVSQEERKRAKRKAAAKRKLKALKRKKWEREMQAEKRGEGHANGQGAENGCAANSHVSEDLSAETKITSDQNTEPWQSGKLDPSDEKKAKTKKERKKLTLDTKSAKSEKCGKTIEDSDTNGKSRQPRKRAREKNSVSEEPQKNKMTETNTPNGEGGDKKRKKFDKDLNKQVANDIAATSVKTSSSNAKRKKKRKKHARVHSSAAEIRV